MQRKFTYDQHGVPVLSNKLIEKLAEIFLRHFHPECFDKPTLTPLGSISTRLIERNGVRFSFDKDLGHRNGKKVLGRICFRTRHIFIDPSVVADGPIFNFTLAHEIGHFALHRKAPLRLPKTEDDGTLSDDTKSIFPLNRIPQSSSDRIESQANRFAAALLMPLKMVQKLVLETQELLDVPPSKRGFIYLDRQQNNRRDFQAIINQMKLKFQTSFTASKIRLVQLGILYEEISDKHISDVMSEMGIQ